MSEETKSNKEMKVKAELPISMYLLMFLQILMTAVVAYKVSDVNAILTMMWLGF